MTTDMFRLIYSVPYFPHSSFAAVFLARVTSATCAAGTVHPSGGHEFVPVIILVLVGFVLFMLSNYMSSRCFFLVPSCDVRYDFRVKMMFNLS